MIRKILAICDSEPAYARSLMERISMKEKISLQVRVFSDAGQLFQYSKRHRIDLLLMEDRYPEEVRGKIPAERRFLLSRAVPQKVSGQETVILKYQSADQIIKQLLEGCRQEFEAGTAAERRLKRGKLLGVYSPVHRIGKTKYALKLGEELSRKGPALYLNLEEYSGLDIYLPRQEKGHLGDLLYYAKQEKEAFAFRLSTMACQLGGLDYIQPVPVTRDIREVTEQEWKELFDQILEKSIYASVILDIGESLQGLFGILRYCDTVYTLYIEEPCARAKFSQYVDNLRKLGYEDILEHTVQKKADGV